MRTSEPCVKFNVDSSCDTDEALLDGSSGSTSDAGLRDFRTGASDAVTSGARLRQEIIFLNYFPLLRVGAAILRSGKGRKKTLPYWRDTISRTFFERLSPK